jgi:hypothetical protein
LKTDASFDHAEAFLAIATALELPLAPSFETGAMTIFCYLAVSRQV